MTKWDLWRPEQVQTASLNLYRTTLRPEMLLWIFIEDLFLSENLLDTSRILTFVKKVSPLPGYSQTGKEKEARTQVECYEIYLANSGSFSMIHVPWDRMQKFLRLNMTLERQSGNLLGGSCYMGTVQRDIGL
ncbi:hypothetical protein KP79_PYT23046 [Mizuhopecten yessoensis]|uniref:Uncharacterized protein n=1 Tax=Mizuhopecten yessoensis TaxID=6573 RepID=A0A210PH86_MIZYE|nr:hypothetical protein KP79_PYT23046 [Mizuhopecten yessoensis]